MKTIILLSVVLLFTINVFPQYLIIHKNVESSLHSKVSEIDSITFCPETVSYAGKIYNVVVIGDQCWLKENLDVGTRINGSVGQTNNGTIEKYCYDDNPSNCTTYGGLYQWNEIMQYVTTERAQGICPDGWHIPTLNEFQSLVTEVGSDGNTLKAIGQGSGGGSGTNTSDFSALLAGHRNGLGTFTLLTEEGQFWSSTIHNSSNCYHLGLNYYGSAINLNYDWIEFGYSVRCLKD